MKWTIAACQGPLGGWPEAREGRAAWLASRGGADREAVERGLIEQDAALLRAVRDGESLVFWCEADPYDLADLAAATAFVLAAEPDARLELVLLDAHPEVANFWGLNQLTAGQLADCFVTRTAISAAEKESLIRAWDALRSGALACRDLGQQTLALPFLADALTRLGEEAIHLDGLGLTERRIVAAAAMPISARELYLEIQRQEHRAWLGDTMVFAMIDELALRLDAPIVVASPGALRSGGDALVEAA